MLFVTIQNSSRIQHQQWSRAVRQRLRPQLQPRRPVRNAEAMSVLAVVRLKEEKDAKAVHRIATVDRNVNAERKLPHRRILPVALALVPLENK